MPTAEAAVGDEMPGLSRLLGGGVGVRRVQPFPEQFEGRRGGGASGANTPPPPPRQLLPVAGESGFVRQNRAVLQKAVAAGRGVTMTPPKPSQRELAHAALQAAQRGRFGCDAKCVCPVGTGFHPAFC